MATHKTTKTATAKAVESEQPTATFSMGETIYKANGRFMDREQWEQFMLNNEIKHPWLGVLAQIGTIAVGFATSIIIASTIANLVAAGTTSMFVVGIALALYYFIGFIGCIMSFRAASVVGDYVANGKFEEHYQDAKSWIKGLFSSKPEVATTVH